MIIMTALMGCANKNNVVTIDRVIDKIDWYDDKKIKIQGYLRISEMLHKSLYFEPNGKLQLDLLVRTENLPEGVIYIPKQFYCVIVEGIFHRYSKDQVALNSSSEFGILEVNKIELCI